MAEPLPLMTDTDIAILRVTAESRRGMKSPHVLVHYEAQLRLIATLDAARAERDEARAKLAAITYDCARCGKPYHSEWELPPGESKATVMDICRACDVELGREMEAEREPELAALRALADRTPTVVLHLCASADDYEYAGKADLALALRAFAGGVQDLLDAVRAAQGPR